MKKIKLIVPLIFLSVSLVSQNKNTDSSSTKNTFTIKKENADSLGDERPLTIVEQMPEFPGGKNEMTKFVQQSIKYPAYERANGIKGTCYVTFIVEKDGRITNVVLLRGIAGGPGCNEEAMRVVSSMPHWKSGMQNGRRVRVQFNLPVKFN